MCLPTLAACQAHRIICVPHYFLSLLRPLLEELSHVRHLVVLISRCAQFMVSRAASFNQHVASKYHSRNYSLLVNNIAPASREACLLPFAEASAALKFALRAQTMATWRSSTALHERTNIGWKMRQLLRRSAIQGPCALQYSRYAHSKMTVVRLCAHLILRTCARSCVCACACACACMCAWVGCVIAGVAHLSLRARPVDSYFNSRLVVAAQLVVQLFGAAAVRWVGCLWRVGGPGFLHN